MSQTRDLGGFTRLEVSGDLSLDIRLFNRPDPGVRITAGTKAIDRIPDLIKPSRTASCRRARAPARW